MNNDQEQERLCIKCNKIKPLKDFVYIKRIDKYKHTCKECFSIYNKGRKDYFKGYYEKNRDKLLQYQKDYIKDEENKEKVKNYKANYYNENQEKIKEYKADYYKNNKDKITKKFKAYYDENQERLIQYQKDYKKVEENKEKIRATKKKYKDNKIQTDELFKMTEQLRNMIRWSFYRKGYAKKGRTKDIIGCDYDTFYNHLLKTFKDNYGYEWNKKEAVHIDHITPLATATTEEEIIKLCHYTNLQLLKAKDNLYKSDKTDYKVQEK